MPRRACASLGRFALKGSWLKSSVQRASRYRSEREVGAWSPGFDQRACLSSRPLRTPHQERLESVLTLVTVFVTVSDTLSTASESADPIPVTEALRTRWRQRGNEAATLRNRWIAT